MKRTCTICKKKRRTTNQENPYCCEPCLRSKGRSLLLNLDEFLEKATQEGRQVVFVVMSFVCLIVAIIVWFISKSLCKYF